MEEQATEVDQEVFTTNNNLLCHLIGYNNDLLVLNQWKGALNRKKPSLLSLLKINVRACTYVRGAYLILWPWSGRLFGERRLFEEIQYLICMFFKGILQVRNNVKTFILLLYPIRDYSVACIKNVYLILL